MFKNLNASFLALSGHESEIIELAMTYGFKGLDLNFEDFRDRAKAKGIDYARRLIVSAIGTGRLRMGSFDLPIQWDVDDEAFAKELASLPELAKMAADLGCKRCLALIAPAGDKRPYHENFDFHKFRFGDICRTLAPFGIQLGLGFRAAENLRKGQAFQFIHGMEATAALIHTIDAPNIGLLLDSWNFKLGGASLDELDKFSGNRIVAVRLADLPAADVAPSEITEELRYMPGATSRVDFAALMRKLAAIGYDGPVTIATHRKALPRGRREAIVEQASQILDRLIKEATAPVTPTAPAPAPAAAAAAEG